jgi:DnaJ-domain-containing protein 1
VPPEPPRHGRGRRTRRFRQTQRGGMRALFQGGTAFHFHGRPSEVGCPAARVGCVSIVLFVAARALPSCSTMRPRRCASRLNLYRVLGVSPSATTAEIRRAHHRLALRYHPDRSPNQRQAAEERIKEINAAASVLRDPGERAAYDASLATTPPTSSPAPPSEPIPTPRAATAPDQDWPDARASWPTCGTPSPSPPWAEPVDFELRPDPQPQPLHVLLAIVMGAVFSLTGFCPGGKTTRSALPPPSSYSWVQPWTPPTSFVPSPELQILPASLTLEDWKNLQADLDRLSRLPKAKPHRRRPSIPATAGPRDLPQQAWPPRAKRAVDWRAFERAFAPEGKAPVEDRNSDKGDDFVDPWDPPSAHGTQNGSGSTPGVGSGGGPPSLVRTASIRRANRSGSISNSVARPARSRRLGFCLSKYF